MPSLPVTRSGSWMAITRSAVVRALTPGGATGVAWPDASPWGAARPSTDPRARRTSRRRGDTAHLRRRGQNQDRCLHSITPPQASCWDWSHPGHLIASRPTPLAALTVAPSFSTRWFVFDTPRQGLVDAGGHDRWQHSRGTVAG